MANNPQAPQYGDKKRLADVGLGTAEGPGGAIVAKRPTGRPAQSPLVQAAKQAAPAQQAAPQAAPVPQDHQDLMRQYAEAESAYQDALRLASTQGAGQWTQFYLQLAQRQRDQAAYVLHAATPNWNITQG